MKKTMMIGTNPLLSIFENQALFQKKITGLILPQDSLQWYTYHMLAMQEEMGEVLKSDKRWKTHRNERFCPEEKLEEMADVFITAINIALFSGFSHEDIANAVLKKIDENFEKLERSKK